MGPSEGLAHICNLFSSLVSVVDRLVTSPKLIRPKTVPATAMTSGARLFLIEAWQDKTNWSLQIYYVHTRGPERHREGGTTLMVAVMIV